MGRFNFGDEGLLAVVKGLQFIAANAYAYRDQFENERNDECRQAETRRVPDQHVGAFFFATLGEEIAVANVSGIEGLMGNKHRCVTLGFKG